jgi:ribosomal protein S18 acetylase RimI-like enzyme
MDNAWLVRDYRPSDFPEVAGIWGETGMGDPRRGDTAEVVDGTLAAGGRLLVLQERDENGIGRLVGTSWITFDGRRLLLHHFAVRPSHQGRGLSKILLSATLRHARERGVPIKLEVHRSNVRAIGLYRKAGFVPLGEYDVLILRDVASLRD